MGHYIATGASATDLLSKVATITTAAQDTVSDPALGEVVCIVTQLSKLSKGKDPGATCPTTVVTPADQGKGLGLSSALPVLRGFVWVRRNPFQAGLIATAVFGGLWYWGFVAGKNRRQAP